MNDDYQFIEFSYIKMSREYIQEVEISDTQRYIVYLDEQSHQLIIKAQTRVPMRRIFGDQPETKFSWKDINVGNGSIGIEINSVPGVVKAIQKIVKFIPLK